MSDAAQPFIETTQYRRFHEFCNSCLNHRYIGVCYGAPGVGKTLSARHYAQWEKAESAGIRLPYSSTHHEALDGISIFYTPPVKCQPTQVAEAIKHLRGRMRVMCAEGVNTASRLRPILEDAERRDQEDRRRFLGQFEGYEKPDYHQMPYRTGDYSKFQSKPTLTEVRVEHSRTMAQIKDPVRLLIIDEAERLTLSAVEQVRAIFDEGGIGVVLMGMPGLERSLSRHAQLYSRVGFVHEFKPLRPAEMQKILPDWITKGIKLPPNALSDEEAMAMIIRITGGNFRLLHRLLLGISEVLEINKVDIITTEVVEAARESLVIGVN